jgi:hypothetical protein
MCADDDRQRHNDAMAFEHEEEERRFYEDEMAMSQWLEDQEN